MTKRAIFTLGLPGSGKSTFLSTLPEYSHYAYVSADKIRITHPDYNPNDPEALHEICVKQAEQDVYRYADIGVEIIMDGGGINDNYTRRIISNLQKSGYHVIVYYINTPLSICIERNNLRKIHGLRFVPSEAIFSKANKLGASVALLRGITEFKEIRYFTDKYLFVDMDGVIAEYQELPIDEEGNINFVSHVIFEEAAPVIQVIKKLQILQGTGTRIFILSASPNSICSLQKRYWVETFLPFVSKEDVYFVGNKDFKHLMLKDLISHLDLERKDCTLIDDDHFILDKVNKLGIRAIHPSKFLANF